MTIYQVNVDLLSKNLSMHNVLRLIHVNPYINCHFLFDPCVCFKYLSTPICLDHISLHPNRGQVRIEDQGIMCRMQRLLRGV